MSYSRQNQSLTSHMLLFDPIQKQAHISDDVPYAKRYQTIHYVDSTPGIDVKGSGEVTFYFNAPNAAAVEVAGLGGGMGNQRHAMTKLENGYWTVTLQGIPAGFHYHEYYVDGTRCINPDAPLGYGCFRPINYFEMPDEQSDFYSLTDIPHGDIRMELYPSDVTGRVKACWVYTPPGYDQTPEEQYPILYIQHGVGENETGWIWQGKLNLIADHLIHEGKAARMIIVMNCGYAFRKDEDPVFFPGDFESELVKSCIPFIEAKYRVLADRDHRAIAGLSLGSTQAFAIGIAHPDLFTWIGVFSGGFPIRRPEYDYTEFFASPDKVNQTLHLLFLSCGEQEDKLEDTMAQARQLTERGCKNIVTAHYPGYHVWDVWRYSLRDFLREVFQERRQ